MSYVIKKERIKALEDKIFLDINTELPNSNDCKKILNNVTIENIVVGCIIFELNDVKQINNHKNQIDSDSMLKRFATIVKNVLRKGDFVGRYSENAIIAVIDDVSKEQLSDITEYVVNKVSQYNIENKDIIINYSYGYAHSKDYPKDTMAILLKQADINMYNYKKRYKYKMEPIEAIKEVEKERLSSRIFEGFSETSNRRYIYMCDMATGVSRWSKDAVEYFDLPGEHFKDPIKVWGSLIHPQDREAYLNNLEDTFSGKIQIHHVAYRVKNRADEYVYCTCRGKIIKGEGAEADLFIGAITNHSIADNIDAVTSLYNIYEFYNYLKRTQGCKNNLYVVLIGNSEFSTINMIYGYNFGNKVLKAIGELLQEYRLDNSTIYRMEGTRFACCIENTSQEQVEAFYSLVRKKLSEGIIVDGIKVSIPLFGGGVSICGKYDEQSIQASANYALQQSKYEKNGEFVFFKDNIYGDVKRNIEIIDEIRQCIKDNCQGFYLAYQPIIDSQKEKIVGAEALIRWKSKKYGEVSPGIFIPWIETDPIFFELGNWIIKTATTQIKPLIEKYHDFKLNVNITYPQMAKADFKNTVINIIKEIQYPSKNLCLEITERCRQLDRDCLKKVIESLKKEGVQFALDDFGTGFSSLDLLNAIPIDILKIDRGFIFDIETNQANQVIVEAVVNCANKLGINVCVEGIENIELKEYVKRYPVYSYQGFYYSKPITIESFMQKYW